MKRIIKAVFIASSIFATTFIANAQENEVDKQIVFTHAVLQDARLSSNYGIRTDPFNNRPSWHSGVDLAAPHAAAVYAPTQGVVKFADTKKGYGKLVELQISETWTLRFAHLHTLNVTNGQEISPGTIIGTVGGTGRGSGPHIHIETVNNGKQLDPMTLEGLKLFAVERAK